MIINEGKYYTGNAYLSLEQMQVNAKFIYNYYLEKGWTAFAICGMLGNMQRESTINPGIWQNLESGNTSLGYGLVQWTPASNYLDWCFENSLESRKMESNLARIDYELANNLQWISTSTYPISFQQFISSTQSPSYLASVFLHNYERAGVSAELERQQNANYWYEYLTGNTPPSGGDDPDDPDLPITPGVSKKRKGYNFVLFNRRRRIYG